MREAVEGASLSGTHYALQRWWSAGGEKRCAAETDVRKRHQTPCTINVSSMSAAPPQKRPRRHPPPAIEKEVSRQRPADADSTLSIDSAQQDSAVPAAPGFGDLACATVKRPGKSSSIPLRSIPSDLPLMGREVSAGCLRQPSDAVYGGSGTSALPRMLRILRRPRPPCGASSGACGSCGPPTAQEGRLAADAAHRATIRDGCPRRGCRCCW